MNDVELRERYVDITGGRPYIINVYLLTQNLIAFNRFFHLPLSHFVCAVSNLQYKFTRILLKREVFVQVGLSMEMNVNLSGGNRH